MVQKVLTLKPDIIDTGLNGVRCFFKESGESELRHSGSGKYFESAPLIAIKLLYSVLG